MSEDELYKGFTESAPFARTFLVFADIFGLRGHFKFARTISVRADNFGSRGNFRFALFLLLIIYFLVYIKRILTKLNCSPFPQAVAKCLSKFLQFSSKIKIIYLIQFKGGKKDFSILK